jgi:hypothetical protein
LITCADTLAREAAIKKVSTANTVNELRKGTGSGRHRWPRFRGDCERRAARTPWTDPDSPMALRWAPK